MYTVMDKSKVAVKKDFFNCFVKPIDFRLRLVKPIDFRLRLVKPVSTQLFRVDKITQVAIKCDKSEFLQIFLNFYLKLRGKIPAKECCNHRVFNCA